MTPFMSSARFPLKLGTCVLTRANDRATIAKHYKGHFFFGKTPGGVAQDAYDLFLLDAILDEGEDVDFVVLCDGQVVGASSYANHGRYSSFAVAVEPTWRGRGIARALVEALLRAHAGDSFWVYVIHPHMAAILSSLGFRAGRVEEGFISRGPTGKWSEDNPMMSLVSPFKKR